MRVALAQINATVGDIAGNAQRVIEMVARAQEAGAGFILLPELVLTGYPPEDLLAKPHFVEENLDALEYVASTCGKFTLVGFVDRIGDELYNASALCGNSRVQQIYHKRRLPNYGVFDEQRYFAAGNLAGLIEAGGTMFSSTICEDIWTPDIVAEAVAEGAQVVFNISASPYHAGKGDLREEMLRDRARENGVWLAYCNLVGGQDELVFDGRSVVISPLGEVVARGASFAEDLVIADFAPAGRLGAGDTIREPLDPEAEVYEALKLGLRDYVGKNGFTDVVLGLSGGIDSAFTATLAADALGVGACPRRDDAESVFLGRKCGRLEAACREPGHRCARTADRRVLRGLRGNAGR